MRKKFTANERSLLTSVNVALFSILTADCVRDVIYCFASKSDSSLAETLSSQLQDFGVLTEDEHESLYIALETVTGQKSLVCFRDMIQERINRGVIK